MIKMKSPRFTTILALLCLSFSGFSQLKVKKLADLPDVLVETSGVALYQDKYLLTHNDSGNDPILFVLDLEGEPVKQIKINAKNKDWEDIAVGPDGTVYIADVGNNKNERTKCRILILPDGFIDQAEVTPQVLTYTYEDQKKFPPTPDQLNYDCEGLVVKGEMLYVFTKCRAVPFTGISFVYEIDLSKSTQKAKRIGKMSLCDKSWRTCSVTAADYNHETGELAILTYGFIYVFSGFEGANFWEGDVKQYSVSGTKQREGLCFAPDGFYMTDEHRRPIGGGNIYHVRIKK